MFRAAVGAPIEAEILSRGSWIAGRALVAERFQQGRIFLGGDAVLRTRRAPSTMRRSC